MSTLTSLRSVWPWCTSARSVLLMMVLVLLISVLGLYAHPPAQAQLVGDLVDFQKLYMVDCLAVLYTVYQEQLETLQLDTLQLFLGFLVIIVVVELHPPYSVHVDFYFQIYQRCLFLTMFLVQRTV